MFGVQRRCRQVGAECWGLAVAFTFGVNLNSRKARRRQDAGAWTGVTSQ
jgi:hypothetical protein